MKITIKEKDYALHFGFDFFDEINRKMGVETVVSGTAVNMRILGLTFLEQGLGAYDPVAVANTLIAGLNTTVRKPTNGEIKQHVEDLLVKSADDYIAFVDELNETIKKQPMLAAYTALQAKLNPSQDVQN